MKNIKLYDNESAYAAASTNRASIEGQVASHVISSNHNYYDGKNLILPTEAAEVGDWFIYDKETSCNKIIKRGTQNKSTLSGNIVIGGKVCIRQGKRLYVLGLNAIPAYQAAVPLAFQISGFDFTNGGSFDINIISPFVTNGNLTATITYPAGSTIDSIKSLMTSALVTDWRVELYVYNDTIIVFLHTYQSTTSLTVSNSTPELTTSQLTLNAQGQRPDVIFQALGLTDCLGSCPDYYCLRKNGITSDYAGLNFPRFKNNYSTSGVTTANVSATNSSIVRQSAFNSTDNPIIYNKYNGDYDAYLQDHCVKMNTGRLIMSTRNAQLATKSLAKAMYTRWTGEQAPYYRPYYEAIKYGILTDGHVTGFEPGNWFVPDAYLGSLICQGLTTDASDIIGEMASMGGRNLLSTEYYWFSSFLAAYCTYFYYGGFGLLISNARYYTNQTRVVAAFDIK